MLQHGDLFSFVFLCATTFNAFMCNIYSEPISLKIHQFNSFRLDIIFKSKSHQPMFFSLFWYHIVNVQIIPLAWRFPVQIQSNLRAVSTKSSKFLNEFSKLCWIPRTNDYICFIYSHIVYAFSLENSNRYEFHVQLTSNLSCVILCQVKGAHT